MKINLGIVGIGNIGSSVIETIEKNKKTYKDKYGIELKIIGISGKNKNKNKNRSFNASKYAWFSNPLEMTQNKEISTIVELVGGSSGIAFKLAKKTLSNKKNLVTANKAMLAINGHKLVSLANKKLVNINFEASVAGGIPIIRLLENSFGSKKKIYNKELEIVKWARRSIVTTKKISKGEKLNRNNIFSKRPSLGIPSYRYFKILGRKVRRDLKENILLKEKDLY